MSNNNNEMKKELGMGAAMATVVGCVIGSGVFFKAQTILQKTEGNMVMGIWAWRNAASPENCRIPKWIL